MSLLNPAILTGLGLAALPILLHLLMRQRPKKLPFPALRLIQVRRRNSMRRMRLRHIWLLLLRVAVIALLVAALARPSLPAANYELSLAELATAAGVLMAAAGAYWGAMRFWRRERLPNHVLSYRRSLLRGGVGTATVLLLLLFVAWPYQRRIAAEISSPAPNVDRNLPVAGVFIFDTSLSMGYRLNSKTRLEVAQEIAARHLEELPAGSRVAVADTSTPNPILFQAESAAAQTRLASLKPRAVSLPLNERLRSALMLQEEDQRRTLESQGAVAEGERRDRYLREIYLFTDLAASAWRQPDTQQLLSELERLPAMQVYLIDVGVDEPTNIGIANLRLSSQTLPAGGDLTVEVTVEGVGTESAEPAVELHVQNDNGSLVKREQRAVAVSGGSASSVTFTVPGITRAITHGEVRLVNSDPLQTDDVRYFTVAADPPPSVLIVSESREESYLWRQALAPSELVSLGKARYNVAEISASQLSDRDLSRNDVICLISVRAPSESTWNALARFVQDGGGLIVVLGNAEIDPVAYNGEVPRTILPAELLGHIRFRPAARLDLQTAAHPIFAKFEYFDGRFGELALVDVRRCWRVDPVEGGSVVARYTDDRGSPALLERVHGRGRTVVLTTAVDRGGWNDLPLAGFRFVALADQIMQYLGHRVDNVYNYVAGERVTLHLDREHPLQRYLLRKPGFEQLPGEVPPGADLLTIDDADQIGHFEVIAAENEPPFSRGFSVNGSSDESRFERISPEGLDAILGRGRYSVARNIEGLTRNVSAGRVGKEMYGWVLVVLIAAFCAEHLAANRFYEVEEVPQEPAEPAAA